ncbi:MAG TPA: AI-2E family transporter [Dermatophilaceae bacterium]|nr:AI-2E family transporter [Dermatophilaceae bacterium]
MAAEGLAASAEPPTTRVTIEPRSVWRAGWTLVAVIALALLLQFVVVDGAPVLFPLVMAFFASIAMEPAVSRLSRWMPRGVAAAVTMLLVLAGLATFLMMFGGLLRDQIMQFAESVPAITAAMVAWVNDTFGTDFDTQTLLASARIDTARITDLATNLAGGLVGVLTNVLSAALTLFAFLFFAFYLSADAVRLRRWVASMFPPRHQVIVLTFWQLALTKIGGYVGARLVLALICGSFTSVFLLIVGVPYWLPLGIWTGVIAQFVPTIGTYLGILLPVLVGLSSDDPRKGLYVLVFAIVYQQIENLTFEPRISARAVSVHPAVSFGSAILGGSLFGASGALVGVPLVAALIAMFDIYKRRWELSEVAAAQAVAAASHPATPEGEQDKDDTDGDDIAAAGDLVEQAEKDAGPGADITGTAGTAATDGDSTGATTATAPPTTPTTASGPGVRS